MSFDSSKKTAVLFMAFGGPDSPDAIEPYINNIVGNRVTKERILQIKERYMQIGGKSPLLDITRTQANFVQKELGENYKVFVGMRWWHPFISDVVKQIKEEGFSQIIGLPLTPYHSKVSTGAYENEFNTAIKNNFLASKFIPYFNTNNLLIEAFVDTIKSALFELQINNLQEVKMIFSVHSIPQKNIDEGDLYLNQINETIQKILKIIGSVDWELGFQSKGGGQIPWLGPEILEIFTRISNSSGKSKQILLVPIGFISDHIETLYDIDIAMKKNADKLGLKFNRTKVLNDNSKFIKALAEIIKICILEKK